MKKGTLIRRIKAWLLHFERRQRGTSYRPALDESHHSCRHCGCAYVGRFCPQCGLPATWRRFTPKQLLAGFLDIWGMGNRPMHRSIGNLFWRPGYMIRDYLSGHHLDYFPPFKMLAITVVLITFVTWLTGAKPVSSEPEVLTNVMQKMVEGGLLSATLRATVQGVLDFFMHNALYRLLIQNLIVVFAVWVVFRKRGYNLVETFFSQIYINCQMQLLTIVCVLLTWRLLDTGLYPYAVPDWMVGPVLVYDFCQLYGLRLWAAIWRTMLVTLLLLFLYFGFLLATVFLLVIGGQLMS